ncbi:MAG TPA: ISNCY family transposase [Vicinamibacterales bacterium]
METLNMNGKERRRLAVLSRVAAGELTLRKGAEVLGLSYRQAKRVYARYRVEGDSGLVHRLRGQPSNHGPDLERRERVLALYLEKYSDFGPTLAAEYLAEEDKQPVAVETLRQWLIEAGHWQVRQEQVQPRKWRARKEHRGELVQMDGSHHDWFEGRRERAVLMVMVDDATGETYARFFEQETTAAAFETFGRYTRHYGLPLALYVDYDSIYHCTREARLDEQLASQAPMTQFGRAMDELGVRLSLAGSPQAKGRVERCNGILQDRLVRALRLRGISDLATANRFLEEEYLLAFNARFAIAPVEAADLHCPLDAKINLDRVLSFQEPRTVKADWTIAWCNRYFQLTGTDCSRGLVGERITVCQQLDGTIHLVYRDRELAYRELTERPARKQSAPTSATPRAPHKPPADHPWRRRALPVKAREAIEHQ